MTSRRNLIFTLAGQYNTASDDDTRIQTYFSRTSLQALREIRKLAAQDHCAISIIAHDSASGFAAQDDAYLAATEPFYKILSEQTGGQLIDARRSFHLTGYEYADTSHLNEIGAHELSSLLAAKIASQPEPSFPDYAVSPDVLRALPPPGISPFTSVILQNPKDPSAELHLHYLQGPALPTIKSGRQVQVIAQLPDQSTASMTGRVVARGEVVVDASKLPTQRQGQVMLVQVTSTGAKWGSAYNWPLASYEWSVATKWQDLGVDSTTVRTEKTSYTPLDLIRVFWKGVESPAPKDWLGVFPVGGSNESRVSMKWTGGGTTGSLQLPANPTAKPGQYEIRLYAHNGWDLITTSTPFEITGLTGIVEVQSKTASRGGIVRAAWHNIHPSRSDDWVGLFPRGGADGSRLDMKFTGGSPQGSAALTVPSNVPLGEYELRLYSAGSWTLLSKSAPFKVGESHVRLTANRTAARPGDAIHARWSGMDSPSADDWIGLFPKGGKDADRRLMQMTGGGAAGSLEIDIPQVPAGEYEFRLYAHDSWSLVAKSPAFRINSKPAGQRQ